jgi:hypothetical protein
LLQLFLNYNTSFQLILRRIFSDSFFHRYTSPFGRKVFIVSTFQANNCNFHFFLV